jgi:hypothetical protein
MSLYYDPYQISFSFLTVYLHTVSAMARQLNLSQEEFLHNSIVNVREPPRMTHVCLYSPTLKEPTPLNLQTIPPCQSRKMWVCTAESEIGVANLGIGWQGAA